MSFPTCLLTSVVLFDTVTTPKQDRESKISGKDIALVEESMHILYFNGTQQDWTQHWEAKKTKRFEIVVN